MAYGGPLTTMNPMDPFFQMLFPGGMQFPGAQRAPMEKPGGIDALKQGGGGGGPGAAATLGSIGGMAGGPIGGAVLGTIGTVVDLIEGRKARKEAEKAQRKERVAGAYANLAKAAGGFAPGPLPAQAPIPRESVGGAALKIGGMLANAAGQVKQQARQARMDQQAADDAAWMRGYREDTLGETQRRNQALESLEKSAQNLRRMSVDLDRDQFDAGRSDATFDRGMQKDVFQETSRHNLATEDISRIRAENSGGGGNFPGSTVNAMVELLYGPRQEDARTGFMRSVAQQQGIPWAGQDAESNVTPEVEQALIRWLAQQGVQLPGGNNPAGLVAPRP